MDEKRDFGAKFVQFLLSKLGKGTLACWLEHAARDDATLQNEIGSVLEELCRMIEANETWNIPGRRVDQIYESHPKEIAPFLVRRQNSSVGPRNRYTQKFLPILEHPQSAVQNSYRC